MKNLLGKFHEFPNLSQIFLLGKFHAESMPVLGLAQYCLAVLGLAQYQWPR